MSPPGSTSCAPCSPGGSSTRRCRRRRRTIAYLTGFQALLYSRPIYLVVTAERTELVVPGLEEEHAGQAAAIDAVTVYYEHPEKGTPGENAPDTLAARAERRVASSAWGWSTPAPRSRSGSTSKRDGLTTGDLSAERSSGCA